MFDYLKGATKIHRTEYAYWRFKHFHINHVMLPYSGFVLSVIPIYLLFGYFDYQHLQADAWIATVTRFVFSFLCVALLLILKRYSPKHLDLAELTLVLCVYWSLTYIGQMAMEQGDFNYQSGGILVMAYIGALSRLPFKASLFGLSFMALCYVVMITPMRLEHDFAEEVDRLSIVIGIYFICLIACLRRESETHKSFQQFCQIRSQQLKLRASQSKLALQTVTDPLTELKNRLYLTQNASLLIQNAKQSDKTLSLLMIDIDNFKSINDSYGHQVGDNVIFGVAQIIRQHCGRYTGMNIRYGGEEFLSVFYCFDKDQLLSVAESILTDVAKLYWPDKDLRVTVSIGAAIDEFNAADIKALTLNELIGQGDSALYRAKKSGKNCIETN
ncbi:GGDEF domain-containing protein [Shewanella olleyana]|uniref:GGDEF domain-containing protein n=1 Tax=Shewanella olleyana TaxID=135626 RepID=UPI00200C0287|nr:GGDEF domain-containing protein [Shewanella olleyana]MCL1066950.1 GGDEF domain-containing protein [Shewanella olleyana]